MKVDYIIVGQGLAGSLVAYELLERNKKILVCDPHTDDSFVAAGGLLAKLHSRANYIKIISFSYPHDRPDIVQEFYKSCEMLVRT